MQNSILMKVVKQLIVHVVRMQNENVLVEYILHVYVLKMQMGKKCGDIRPMTV